MRKALHGVYLFLVMMIIRRLTSPTGKLQLQRLYNPSVCEQPTAFALRQKTVTSKAGEYHLVIVVL